MKKKFVREKIFVDGIDVTNPFFKFLSVEDKEHIKVVNYVNEKYPEVIYTHIPAEGRKSFFERYKYSLMGTKKGFPDFIFLHPKYKLVSEAKPPYRELIFHGLAIELKAQEHERVVKKGKKEGKVVKAKGKLSEEQAVLIERINKVKYKAVCCYGSVEAIKIIDEYLKK